MLEMPANSIAHSARGEIREIRISVVSLPQTVTKTTAPPPLADTNQVLASGGEHFEGCD